VVSSVNSLFGGDGPLDWDEGPAPLIADTLPESLSHEISKAPSLISAPFPFHRLNE
jgi:hypothetical protein